MHSLTDTVPSITPVGFEPFDPCFDTLLYSRSCICVPSLESKGEKLSRDDIDISSAIYMSSPLSLLEVCNKI